MSTNETTLVRLSDVRLSFPHIAEPQKTQGPKGERISYNAEFILAPDHPAWGQFHQIVLAMATAKWKEQAQGVINLCNGDRKKRCYGGGSEKINQKTLKVYDGYEGMVFISAGKDKMPQIFDSTGKQIDPNDTMALQKEARRMYGGCRVNAAVKPWLQENEHGRAIRADFVAIQFLADDTPFGEGAVDASGLFGATPAAGAVDSSAAPPWAAPAAMPAPPFQGAPTPAPAAPAWAQPAAAPAPQWAQPSAPATPPWM